MKKLVELKRSMPQKWELRLVGWIADKLHLKKGFVIYDARESDGQRGTEQDIKHEG
jgi:hypothetical protein